MHRSYRPLKLAALLIVSLSMFARASGKNLAPKPFFRQDLRQFGFPISAGGKLMSNFTNVNFLSDDFILVTVNTRIYGPVEHLNADQPPSRLLLFDLSQNALAISTEMPIEKNPNSVRATHGGNFVLLNESGVHLCSRDLKCSLSIASTGPLFVSPQGTRVVVGGNGQTEQKLLDADSLKQLDHFSWGQTQAVPGDDGRLLVRRNGKMYLRLPEIPEQALPLKGEGIWEEARFLNNTVLADFESETALAVVGIDGNILFRQPVKARWHVSELCTTASGSRFCFHEAGYTTFNSIVNFLDIDSGRHFNFENVKVISTDSGASLLELSWDPRPYVGLLSPPVLSPDGHKLAVIHGGFLEVYRVP